MTLTAAAVPNVVSSMEQIITTFGIFYAVIDPANIFFSIPDKKKLDVINLHSFTLRLYQLWLSVLCTRL